MAKLKTFEGWSSMDHVLGTVMGIVVLALSGTAIVCIYKLIINIDLKLCAFWGSIGLVAAFVAWNIGYWCFRSMSLGMNGIFKCGCGHESKHPILEMYHKKKCLSYILNGRYHEINN
jgi:hypothetical protein